MTDPKRQWLARALAGGIIGAALLLAYVYVNKMGMGALSNPFAIWAHWFQHDPSPSSALVNLGFAFLTGAEVGIATLPFADSGRKLVLYSLAHYGVMSVTVGVWIIANFGWRHIPFFLLLLTLVYLIIWLVRWVRWHWELSAIRKKLGLNRKKGGRTHEKTDSPL